MMIAHEATMTIIEAQLNLGEGHSSLPINQHNGQFLGPFKKCIAFLHLDQGVILAREVDGVNHTRILIKDTNDPS